MNKKVFLLLFAVAISGPLVSQTYPFTLYGPGLDGSTNQQFALYAETQYGLLFEAPLDAAGNRLSIVFGWRNNRGIYALRIDKLGRVGIGHSDQTGIVSNLDIRGANTITDSNGNILVCTNSTYAQDAGGQITLGGAYSSDKYAGWACIAGRKSNNISGDGSSYLLFGTADYTTTITEKMRIDSEGRVGIGTAAPAYKLDVNGTIRAKEVKVTLDGWSDFVFAPTYRLKPLSEVEQYIKTHGHLENIPTAKEVEQNGVSVGDMQQKLLEKVEQLTLYVIEQEKIIEKQGEKIKLLEESINRSKN